jgi:putative membrane protein
MEIVAVAAAAVAYQRGLASLRTKPAARTTVPNWRVAAFVLGIVVVLVAVSPPVDRLAHEMFSAHMAQHVLLILVAAPLLAAGAPQVVIPRAFPRFAHRVSAPVRRRVPRLEFPDTVPTLLVLGTGLHLAALWAWHAPSLYEAALQSRVVHAFEHAAFLGTALVVWTMLLQPGRRARIRSGIGVLCVWALLAQGAILSALLVFAGEPLYATYGTGGAFGLDPLSDQQLAGVVMWLPGGIVYGVAGVATFLTWFRAVDERARARDGTPAPPQILRAPDAVSAPERASR